jgi:hypothetical protein
VGDQQGERNCSLRRGRRVVAFAIQLRMSNVQLRSTDYDPVCLSQDVEETKDQLKPSVLSCDTSSPNCSSAAASFRLQATFLALMYWVINTFVRL